MTHIIQLSKGEFIKDAYFNYFRQLVIKHTDNIANACNWDKRNAKMLLPDIKVKFPGAKLMTK